MKESNSNYIIVFKEPVMVYYKLYVKRNKYDKSGCFYQLLILKGLFFKMKQLLIFEYRPLSKKQNSVICDLMLIDPGRDYRQTALMNGHSTENVVSLKLKLHS